MLEAKALTALAEGDVLIAGSAGGAGYGDPLRRDPAAVVADLGGGLVSEAAAREVYGVIAPGGVYEAEATERAREAIRAARLRDGRRPDAQARAPSGAAGEGELVSDTVTAAGGWLWCTVCGHALGPDADLLGTGSVRELPLTALGPRFARCRPACVLREHACPGCGTAFAVDVDEAARGPRADTRLRGGSP